MKSRKLQFAALAAAAILATAGTAFAQPMGGPGHGHHGGPGEGMEIGQVLSGLKDQLNLDTSQQLNWTNAVAAAKSAHVAMRAGMKTVHDALAAELAKPTPDLAAVAAVVDSVRASNQTLRLDVRKQWLQIYANLKPEQVAIVRAALTAQLARMEAMRARMQQRMQGGG
jgi:Spy/CpxP family protein refolding chaperone